MPERARSSSEEPLLDLPEDESLSTEHLDSQVQKAQEALLSLKRQQDQIEKQKRELEELSRRQEQLQQGKSEMVEKFVRAMVVLERETYEAKKRVEALEAIHGGKSYPVTAAQLPPNYTEFLPSARGLELISQRTAPAIGIRLRSSKQILGRLAPGLPEFRLASD